MQRIAFADVRRVVLVHQPLLIVERWLCFVEGGGVRIWIPSCSFTDPAHAEDRRASYRPFVEALSQAIAAGPAARAIRFIQGAKWSSRASLAVLASVVVLGLLLLLATILELAFGVGLSNIGPTAILELILVAVGALLWREGRKNWRHPFDPNALPADFAPVGSESVWAGEPARQA